MYFYRAILCLHKCDCLFPSLRAQLIFVDNSSTIVTLSSGALKKKRHTQSTYPRPHASRIRQNPKRDRCFAANRRIFAAFFLNFQEIMFFFFFLRGNSQISRALLGRRLAYKHGRFTELLPNSWMCYPYFLPLFP